jgi:hypothetical protein
MVVNAVVTGRRRKRRPTVVGKLRSVLGGGGGGEGGVTVVRLEDLRGGSQVRVAALCVECGPPPSYLIDLSQATQSRHVTIRFRQRTNLT